MIAYLVLSMFIGVNIGLCIGALLSAASKADLCAELERSRALTGALVAIQNDRAPTLPPHV